MPAIKRPSREFSFSDYAKNNPRGPFPGDRLDAQIQVLIDAILSTQARLATIVRDDGQLKNASIGPQQLSAGITDTITDAFKRHTGQMAMRAEAGAARALNSENTIHLMARDAENAAFSAAQFLSAVNTANDLVERNTNRVINATDVAQAEATSAENWASYSQAQADNAIKAKDEALAWAEYLAGPVVDAGKAPAYIAGSPFPHGLYYQPVEGYGGLGGLWSAKWWAVYAAQLVGPWGYYYLGGWADPPTPGAVNPGTGVKVPTPLAPGSFYYDTDANTAYVWNGSEWHSPFELAAGVTSRFVYQATANQKVFTGADFNSAIPKVGSSPSDVHLNGVRLVENIDYTINASTSTLTLTIPVPANAIVQWDLLVPPSSLVPGAVNAFKVQLTPATPNGTVTNFTMAYTHPVNGPTPVNVTNGAQLQVSIDGIIQEPGKDYTATGATLTMTTAPAADAHFWAVWFANATLTS